MNTTAAAYYGSHSLLTTTGATGAGGPAITASSVPSGRRAVHHHRLRDAHQRRDRHQRELHHQAHATPACSGGTCYDTIGTYQVPVTDSGWAQIGGTYTVSTTETGLTLYAQLVGATTAQSFYLDDVVITETAPPPGGTPDCHLHLRRWRPRWLDAVRFRDPDQYRAARSSIPMATRTACSSTNRTASLHGPEPQSAEREQRGGGRDLPGHRLRPAGRARQQQSHRDDLHQNGRLRQPSGAYGNIATSAALSSTAWTKVQGTFSFSDLPGPPTSLILYIQSSSATDSFYIERRRHQRARAAAAQSQPAGQHRHHHHL